MLLYKTPWLISLAFVGRIGTEELAAAALATTLCNVTGMSLSVGLSSALTTLTGNARGDLISRRNINLKRKHDDVPEDEEELLTVAKPESYNSIVNINGSNIERYDPPLLPLTYLYRGIFIQLVLVIPVGLWWLSGIKPILVSLGQGESLSEMTAEYLKILTPGLWSYSVNMTLTTWLQTIEMADVPAYAAFVGLIIHVPANMFFIHLLGWGYLGVGVATVLFQLVQPFLILMYLFGTQQGKARVLEHTIAEAIGRTQITFWREAKLAVTSVSGLCQYLALAVPGIIIISEWWASEISIFLAGRLQPNPAFALAGMTIYQSINTSCFMFPVGISIAGSSRVGNKLGSGDPLGAALSAKVSVFTAGVLSATLGLVLYTMDHTFFPRLFTPDQDVILEASRTIPFLALYVFADGVQIALNGVIKGCGRQCHMLPVIVIAYWIVGIPLAYHLTFVQNDGYMCGEGFCGVVGLVAGMTAGTVVHFVLLFALVAGTTNWDVEAQKAQARLSLENDDVITASSA
eukprot:CAMPEP_0195282402 /NCGR_PEP_ID=MMETSP0707-20130614/1287_1 /TAXON_ID=33640 /ORGANISM="Asterionellopsis glacialis, Strain CCMP134" /LENGTH=517 /DNA_ID=CAMNT_0040341367 /DNA_START=128 /DNA_END=1681 /DNA_ORIENTATION=-